MIILTIIPFDYINYHDSQEEHSKTNIKLKENKYWE